MKYNRFVYNTTKRINEYLYIFEIQELFEIEYELGETEKNKIEIDRQILEENVREEIYMIKE